MAKRHKSLIELSHDHHHGLALALRLRQGNDALLNDGWTHDRTGQAERVKMFYEEELSRHFKEEEEVLFPAMVNDVPQCAELVTTLLKQHRQMEGLIVRISTAQADALPRLLVELGVVLEDHIRKEERSLFPIFETEMLSDTSSRVGEELQRLRERSLTQRKTEIRKQA